MVIGTHSNRERSMFGSLIASSSCSFVVVRYDGLASGSRAGEIEDVLRALRLEKVEHKVRMVFEQVYEAETSCTTSRCIASRRRLDM